MKLVKLFISVAILLTGMQLKAQNDLTIEYIQTINIHKSLSSDQAAMKAFLPETIEKKVVYKYKDNKARIKEVKMEKKEKTSFNMQMSGASSNALIDYKNKKGTEYHKIMNNYFCVEKDLGEMDLEFSNETKEILGYKCTKATRKKDDGDKMIFWIAKDISIKASPLFPMICKEGAILAIDGDKISYEAKLVSKSKLSSTDILTPPTARQITSEQLEDLQEEQIEEMQNMN